MATELDGVEKEPNLNTLWLNAGDELEAGKVPNVAVVIGDAVEEIGVVIVALLRNEEAGGCEVNANGFDILMVTAVELAVTIDKKLVREADVVDKTGDVEETASGVVNCGMDTAVDKNELDEVFVGVRKLEVEALSVVVVEHTV